MMLPLKKSFRWIYILIGTFIINISALLLSRVVLNIEINFRNVIGFAIISIIVSVIASAGYFGIRKFSLTFIIVDIIGICYLFFTVISGKSTGWADLTSVIGFMVLLVFGVCAGIIAELIFWIVRRKK